MLQIRRVTAFTVFELLRESQLGAGVKLAITPTRLGLMNRSYHLKFVWEVKLYKYATKQE